MSQTRGIGPNPDGWRREEEGGGINRARGPQEPRPARAKQNKELPGVQFRPTTRKIGHSDGYRNKSRKGDDLGNESEGIDRDRDKERERERERERETAHSGSMRGRDVSRPGIAGPELIRKQ